MTAVEVLTRLSIHDHTSPYFSTNPVVLLTKNPSHDEHQQFLTTGFIKNKLFYGDNLDIVRRYIINESVDLVYLDPPFNSKADYNILFREPTGEQSTAQIQAFSDFWHWDEAARKSYEYLTSNVVDHKIANLTESFYQLLGKNDMTAYLFMMTIRLMELHRILKPTGSLFLHCDPNASHYLKLLLDGIFGSSNFRAEIIWERSHARSSISRNFRKAHDVILFYSKTNDYVFKTQYKGLSEESLKLYRKNKDNRGYYQLVPVLVSGIRHGETGKTWRGINPNKLGKAGMHWVTKPENLEKYEKVGLLVWAKKKAGLPRLKYYLNQNLGVPVSDLWYDLGIIEANSSESVGYPTQKPLSLLKRIINTASNEGDWILDPFCGCGTAILAAESLKRHWIGIDITSLAINIMKTRMKEMFPYSEFDIEGEPKDIGAAIELAKDRYQFQWWALSLIHARPVGSKPSNPREGKKGADEGVDGWLVFRIDEKLESIVIQVKSGHVGVDKIRELRDTITRQKASMGIFITLEEPTSEMIKEVKATEPYIAKSLNMEFPKIQILTIKELLDGVKPNIPQTASAFPQAVITKTVSGKDSSTLDDFTEE